MSTKEENLDVSLPSQGEESDFLTVGPEPNPGRDGQPLRCTPYQFDNVFELTGETF
jgi:hypothetical protein